MVGDFKVEETFKYFRHYFQVVNFLRRQTFPEREFFTKMTDFVEIINLFEQKFYQDGRFC